MENPHLETDDWGVALFQETTKWQKYIKVWQWPWSCADRIPCLAHGGVNALPQTSTARHSSNEQDFGATTTGWWLSHPSEKYERKLGWLFPLYGKIKNVPNHQPDEVLQSTRFIFVLNMRMGKKLGTLKLVEPGKRISSFSDEILIGWEWDN